MKSRINDRMWTRRAVLISVVPGVLMISDSAPAGAADPPTSPPTTLSAERLGDEVATALQPWIPLIVAFVVLSILAKEIERSRKRRRKRSRAVRSPRRRRAPAKPRPAASGLDSGTREQMWGRQPGQSVADHIARLDAERAKWARGHEGEIVVGNELDGLNPDEWWTFHAIPRGNAGTDIDHLVIGDVGRRISMKLQRPVAVHPILAFTSPITVKAMPSDVRVLRAGAIREWLESRARGLTPTAAYEIVLAANEPSTCS